MIMVSMDLPSTWVDQVDIQRYPAFYILCCGIYLEVQFPLYVDIYIITITIGYRVISQLVRVEQSVVIASTATFF